MISSTKTSRRVRVFVLFITRDYYYYYLGLRTIPTTLYIIIKRRSFLRPSRDAFSLFRFLRGVPLRRRRRFGDGGRRLSPASLLPQLLLSAKLVQRVPGVPPVQQRLAAQPGHLRPGYDRRLSAQTRRERRRKWRRPGRVPRGRRRRRRRLAVLRRRPSVPRVLLNLQLIVH